MSSISTSFKTLTTRFPISFRKTLIPSKPSNLLFFSIPTTTAKTITFQRCPAKLSSSPQPFPTPSQPIESLPSKLQEIVKLFQSVQDPTAKYQQLLFYGKNLTPLASEFKTNENKVEGCVSQVWVRAFLDEKSNVFFEADSDSALTKGLAALLVKGLSGNSVQDILRVSPDFVVLLGFQQQGMGLTPSRTNGFLNMLKLMQKKALELGFQGNKDRNDDWGLGSGSVSELGSAVNEVRVKEEEEEEEEEEEGGATSENGGSGSSELGSRGMRIKELLDRQLSPVELDIEDVSYQHAGHAGTGGGDGETHFNVKIVSKEFEGKSLVKRHRLVYNLLHEELQSGLHALSIVAKTPSEVSGK